MTRKIAISISDRSFEYLQQKTNNRSQFIENLLLQQQKQDLESELEQAYKDQENDPEFHREIAAWDCVTGDGIDEESDSSAEAFDIKNLYA